MGGRRLSMALSFCVIDEYTTLEHVGCGPFPQDQDGTCLGRFLLSDDSPLLS
jgi:hypothetical protein